MRPASHRIPVCLPSERSLEEVILATKIIAPTEAHFPNTRNGRYSQTQTPPQRGMLASPSSPSSFLSCLPPESYAREVSSRLGKRRRSNAVRRATPERTSRSGNGFGGTGSVLPLPHSLLRPLTGVSPPSTAQSSFSLADFANDGVRPTVRDSHATRWCSTKSSHGLDVPHLHYVS